jgi:hypothetical protein
VALSITKYNVCRVRGSSIAAMSGTTLPS